MKLFCLNIHGNFYLQFLILSIKCFFINLFLSLEVLKDQWNEKADSYQLQVVVSISGIPGLAA